MQIKNHFYIIGLGYVGLTFALYSCKKINVIGVEKEKKKLLQLKNGITDVLEADINVELSRSLITKNFVLKNNIACYQPGNTFMITPGTPLNKSGKVDLTMINSIVKTLSKCVYDGDLVLIRSTVKIGTTKKIKEKLNKHAEVSVCFVPERTVEGDAINEIGNLPQIVGAETKQDYFKAKSFFKKLGIKVLPQISLEEAEMAKLLCNSERDLYFALANEVAFISERLGLNAYNIISTCTKGYSRSSLKKPGLVGGPCLEKDPYILKQSLPSDFNFKLLTKSRDINNLVVKRSLTRIISIINKKKIKLDRVSILGCAFKGFPITADVRGSLIYEIIKDLKKMIQNNISIVLHDFNSKLVNLQDKNLSSVSDLYQSIKNSDLIILQNNHPKYKDYDWNSFICKNPKIIIYDFWNHLKLDYKENYYSFGIANEE